MKVNGQPTKLVLEYLLPDNSAVYVATQRVADLGVVKADLAELIWSEAMGHGRFDPVPAAWGHRDATAWLIEPNHTPGSVLVDGALQTGLMFRGEGSATIGVNLGDILVAVTCESQRFADVSIAVQG